MYIYVCIYIYVCVCVHAKSFQSCLCVILWTAAHQAPLSMELSQQEYWSGFPFPSPGYLTNPGIKLTSTVAPALAGKFFTTEPLGKPR